MSETARDLLREALTAKLAADLGRAHRATTAAEHAGRRAVQLVEELAGARAREELDELHLDDELAELLAAAYPPAEDDDEPAGPT